MISLQESMYSLNDRREKKAWFTMKRNLSFNDRPRCADYTPTSPSNSVTQILCCCQNTSFSCNAARLWESRTCSEGQNRSGDSHTLCLKNSFLILSQRDSLSKNVHKGKIKHHCQELGQKSSIFLWMKQLHWVKTVTKHTRPPLCRLTHTIND